MLFIFRDIIRQDNNIQNYIKDTYGSDIQIRYSNVGFIVIPNYSNHIIKYYLSDSYMSDKTWNEKRFSVYEKEKNNYDFFLKNNVLIPKYISSWDVKIWNYIFKYAKIENIRRLSKKIVNFSELDINKFANFIKKIHTLKSWYIHWSIHTSDFFLTKSWEIWIFDLVSYYKWYIEQDIARICYWYFLESNFIKEFLIAYWMKEINLSKLLSEIYSLAKLHEINKNNFLKTIYLIVNLNNKSWNV